MLPNRGYLLPFYSTACNAADVRRRRVICRQTEAIRDPSEWFPETLPSYEKALAIKQNSHWMSKYFDYQKAPPPAYRESIEMERLAFREAAHADSGLARQTDAQLDSHRPSSRPPPDDADSVPSYHEQEEHGGDQTENESGHEQTVPDQSPQLQQNSDLRDDA